MTAPKNTTTTTTPAGRGFVRGRLVGAVRLRRVLTAIPIALLPLIASLALLAVADLETAADPVGATLGFYLGGL